MSNQTTATNLVDVIEGRVNPPAAARLLGWRFVGFDRDAGILKCASEATEEFLNPTGVVQGGLLAAMLDEAMGPVASMVEGEGIFAQTLEMKVSFLAAARVGTTLGEGRIVKRGKENVFLEGKFLDSSGKLLVVCTATARIVRALNTYSKDSQS